MLTDSRTVCCHTDWLCKLTENAEVFLVKYLFLLCFAISLSAIAAVPSDAVQFKLKRISEGDTVVTTEDTRIRLWGIDTPERDQQHGTDATEALTEMLHNQQLYLETKDVDRYGRTVGVI